MLSLEEVEKIAKLSKLKLSDEELAKMQTTMNQIFEHVEELNELDVTDVEPLYNVNEIIDRTRPDEVCNTVKKEDFLKNAPEKDENFVILPRIVY